MSDSDDNEITLSSIAWFFIWVTVAGMGSLTTIGYSEIEDSCELFTAGIVSSAVVIPIFWVVRSRGLPKWFATGVASGSVSYAFFQFSECTEAPPVVGGVISLVVMALVGLFSCGGEVEEDWDNCAKARAILFSAFSYRLAAGNPDSSAMGLITILVIIGFGSPRVGMGLLVGYDFFLTAVSFTSNAWQAFAGLSVIAAFLIKKGAGDEADSGPILG